MIKQLYLTKPLLLFQSVFRQLLPLRLHGQTHYVLFANCDQLLGLKQKKFENSDPVV